MHIGIVWVRCTALHMLFSRKVCELMAKSLAQFSPELYSLSSHYQFAVLIRIVKHHLTELGGKQGDAQMP